MPPPFVSLAALVAVVPIGTQFTGPPVRSCTLNPVSLVLLSGQVRSIREGETGVAVSCVGAWGLLGDEDRLKTLMRWFLLSAT